MGRNPKIIVMIGGRGTGKTTLAKQILENHPSRRQLVVDTMDHPGWAHLDKRHELADLQRFKSGSLRIFGPMPRELIKAIRQHVKNSLIIFEDARKFTGNRISEDMEAILIDSKQRGNEILFMYHGYPLVPRSMGYYMDRLILLKTNILPNNSHKDRFGDIETVIQAAERVNAHPNRYHYETVITES